MQRGRDIEVRETKENPQSKSFNEDQNMFTTLTVICEAICEANIRARGKKEDFKVLLTCYGSYT